jgi:hypothetical protein
MSASIPFRDYLARAESQRASRTFEYASLPPVPLGSSDSDMPEHEFLDSVINTGATFKSATGFTPTVIAEHLCLYRNFMSSMPWWLMRLYSDGGHVAASQY